MELKKIALFISFEINKKYKKKTEFAKIIGKPRQRITNLLTDIIKKDVGTGYKTIEELLNKLGYELTITEKRK